MKRRQLMGYAGGGLACALLTNLVSHNQTQAQSSGSLSIRWLGHTCFLFTGSNLKILANPFRPVGCTAGYRPPQVPADLVMISSQLLDEGAVDKLTGSPKLIYQPGAYEYKDIKFQGVAIAHDRIDGKRFGMNTAWQWEQDGINILNLGGAAAPISLEQKILMGQPDVLLVPVGGGPKAYNGQEAKQAIQMLAPKLVIPTHYRTQAADTATCDIAPIDEFLSVMDGTPVKRSKNEAIALSASSLPQTTTIQILSYNF